MVGKPAEFMLANISESFGLERNQICMVGDRLDTDILFGQNGGLSTCLVLSGKARNTFARLGCHPSLVVQESVIEVIWYQSSSKVMIIHLM